MAVWAAPSLPRGGRSGPADRIDRGLPGVNFPDNRDVPTTGTYANPVEPPNLGAGGQFVSSTLPLGRMQASSPYAVVQNTSVVELAPSGPQRMPGGPTLCPLPCYRAIEGSGGGFLPNEVAYRVTALRDRLAPAIPAGHMTRRSSMRRRIRSSATTSCGSTGKSWKRRSGPDPR